MITFDIDELIRQQVGSGRLYFEFLKESSLSMGLYVLPTGGVDPQQPHDEDEVYYVIEGEGMITVGDEVEAVGPGRIIYVGRGVAHHFHDILQELKIVVFFAPAES